MSGDLSVNETGFAVENGVISGYLTDESLFSISSEIAALCEAAARPAFCNQIAIFGNDPMTITALLEGLLGGYDTEFHDGIASPCEDPFDGTCNAFGVCLLVEFEPATVHGVAAE